MSAVIIDSILDFGKNRIKQQHNTSHVHTTESGGRT